ncbi:MAG: helix-turn-helix domain-containing protein [Deltaproteobacteria bacterium]|nr:helix-turn-helix domain-containing protein [Deltaproteobacteria bacterium]
MTYPVEIVAAEPAQAQIAAGHAEWPRSVRFLASPSSRKVASRLLVARLEELEQQARWRDLALLLRLLRRQHADSSLVLLGPGRGKSTTASIGQLQGLALLSKSSTPGSKLDPYIVPDEAAFRRLMLARFHGAEKQIVASASIEDGILSVWSCEPRLYQLPVEDIPVLAALGEEALRAFEVSETGSRIHWAEGDVDINMDTVREHADADYRKKHQDEHRKEAARYGKAIRALREKRGLSQKRIPGLSDRQVRRLEEGKTVPHLSSLRKVAEAHGMDIEAYLAELAKLSGRTQSRGRR